MLMTIIWSNLICTHNLTNDEFIDYCISMKISTTGSFNEFSIFNDKTICDISKQEKIFDFTNEDDVKKLLNSLNTNLKEDFYIYVNNILHNLNKQYDDFINEFTKNLKNNDLSANVYKFKAIFDIINENIQKLMIILGDVLPYENGLYLYYALCNISLIEEKTKDPPPCYLRFEVIFF
ncbi:hypothetical protein A0H76_1191 [Hepatospora eriocheir]|uniref:Uncharacterized protein n=1 Tax=Hepatospora eriocheir TaxID=1081669 RepID=A0A1X0QHI1_9MICR|nr:hypothetical protein A0H76_1191 [Hepatospora eriocheir]